MIDDNGLTSFAIHVEDSAGAPEAWGIEAGIDAEAVDQMRSLDPEDAARRYLDQAATSPTIESISETEPGKASEEYRPISTETVALTDTQIVKFNQYHDGIPLFGSTVAVEMNMDNSLVSLSSESPRQRPDVDSTPSITPEQVKEACLSDTGTVEASLAGDPTIQYFYDGSPDSQQWRLVYVQPNVTDTAPGDEHATAPEVFDYVVDAHTGDLVTKLPLNHSAGHVGARVRAHDGLGKSRHVGVTRDAAGNTILVDPDRRIETYDFGFRDISRQRVALPGIGCAQPPDWNSDAISAHANAADVADFVKKVLKRDGLDGKGHTYVSSINCVQVNIFNPPPDPRSWRNAAWLGDRVQMVYGQHLTETGSLRSYALAKDVVAHEITHGLIQFTAGLKYEGQTGALNESYADIFGIIISNFDKNIARWNWEMGEDLQGTGVPLRDISNPTRFDQPDHMDQYRQLPIDRANDWGGVHINSGIHNKAGYNLLTSVHQGQQDFEPSEVASLLYLALLKLGPSADFATSRLRIEDAAKTLYRSADAAVKARKLEAIGEAFSATGIASTP